MGRYNYIGFCPECHSYVFDAGKYGALHSFPVYHEDCSWVSKHIPLDKVVSFKDEIERRHKL